LAATVLYLGGVPQLDPRRNAVATPPIATSTPRPVFHPKTLGEERLAVCCHHVTAFNVQPNISWGKATLEEQSQWMKWKCSDVLKQHFGTFEDAPTKCRSLGTPTYTFYMYRVSGDTDWPIENVNAASLGGVLWYLHNEVVTGKPRKFGITRMRRYKVQVAGTRALAKLNMTFGVRFAWDTQECTGAGPFSSKEECDAQFKKYGYFIGCNNLGSYPFPTAAKGFPNHYPEAVWYSLPRKGRCHGRPTGEDNCTYNFEEVGNMTIDELVGIKDYGRIGVEYNEDADHGWGISWWDRKFDDGVCRKRWLHAKEMWARKYPDQESDEDRPAPSCDFKCDFYPHPPAECGMEQPKGPAMCSNHKWCYSVMMSYHAPSVGHYGHRLYAINSSTAMMSHHAPPSPAST
jgi:hypothetical protein